jgi:hypothetical protein
VRVALSSRIVRTGDAVERVSVDAEDEVAIQVLAARLARERHRRAELETQDVQRAGDALGAAVAEVPRVSRQDLLSKLPDLGQRGSSHGNM